MSIRLIEYSYANMNDLPDWMYDKADDLKCDLGVTCQDYQGARGCYICIVLTGDEDRPSYVTTYELLDARGERNVCCEDCAIWLSEVVGRDLSDMVTS